MTQNDNELKAFLKLSGSKSKGKNLNWLLVMPKLTVLDEQQYSFPVGIAYISSVLKTTGRNVFTINLNYKKKDTYTILKDCIEQNSIDIIACGGITTQYRLLKEIIDIAKEIKPGIITIVGGGLITSEPVAAMQALENADYGIVGEGELTICELASNLEAGITRTNPLLRDVAGLVYSDDNLQWVVTGPRPEIMDLDIIPWPDYDGFEYDQMLNKTPIDILTGKDKNESIGICFYSRSCPYNCTFCFHSSGKKYRTRTLDSFFEEFDYLINKYAFSSFFLADEYFISDFNFVVKFCDRMKKYNIRWTCSGRVDNITKELLLTLKDAGCFQIQLGVESACDRILKSMRKNITREQIERAFLLCEETGIATSGNLIFGDLEETVETAMESIDWYKSHPKWSIAMHWIIAYPGTHVYKISRQRGIIPDAVEFIKSGCPEVNFSKMTDEERRKIVFIINNLTSEKHDVLSNAKLTEDMIGKVTVEGDCAYCNSRITLYNLDPIRPMKIEVCPSCGHTLRIYGIDYANFDIFETNIKSLLKEHKIAIWPVVFGVSKLVEYTQALSSKNVYLVDSSPFKQGIEIAGKVIQSPSIINEQNIDTVLLTTTTNVGNEIMNIIEKEYKNVSNVIQIGTLLFQNSYK